MADQTPARELTVPKQSREVVGAWLLMAIVVLPSALAVYNLVNRTGIIPSSLWLLLVGGGLFSYCHELGTRRVLAEIIGAFARKHFVRADQTSGMQIQFGYHLLGRCFLYLSIPIETIRQVNWSAGQASSMSGREMNDWSVVVWYDGVTPPDKAPGLTRRKAGDELHIVGSCGPKAATATFGLMLVNFLRQSGAALVQGKDECTFVR